MTDQAILIHENEALRARLSHLLESKTISLFDEVDPATGEYKRQIQRLDTYGVHDKLLKFEKQHGVGYGLPGHVKPEQPDPEPPKPCAPKQTGRPCKVLFRHRTGEEVQDAFFHGFFTEASVVPASSLRGGHPGGQVSTVQALVELRDGSVVKVDPGNIHFIDSRERFESHAWCGPYPWDVVTP